MASGSFGLDSNKNWKIHGECEPRVCAQQMPHPFHEPIPRNTNENPMAGAHASSYAYRFFGLDVCCKRYAYFCKELQRYCLGTFGNAFSVLSPRSILARVQSRRLRESGVGQPAD